MPLLTITGSVDLSAEEQSAFLDEVAGRYVDVMDSQTSYLSIVFQDRDRADLYLGRADPEADVVLLEADVRRGRSVDRRREFALSFMDLSRDTFGLPRENLKVVYTEHDGSHMMGYDRVGGDWEAGD